MRILRFIPGKRIVASGLLVSLLLTLVFPLKQLNTLHASDYYANWLKKQLKGVTSEAIESAFEATQGSDAEDLTDYLQTFIGAYSQLATQEEASLLGHEAFFQILKLRHQLLDNPALPPNLLLKSALYQIISVKDRSLSFALSAFYRSHIAEHRQNISLSLVPALSTFLLEHQLLSISPRAP